ncbi:MAG: NAD-dependent epimerase/dehydratase family protein, partial [Pirellulales bacterium]|nr:NAD-dependent epimerase/dehydratase family protein [Pirellulales bacterium]
MQTIVISGSSGLVGSALLPRLKDSGHRVRRLVRGAAGSLPESIRWDPDSGRLDPADLEGADAVVHLGGESIASGRWTAQRRQRIRDSRVISTRLLARSIA